MFIVHQYTVSPFQSFGKSLPFELHVIAAPSKAHLWVVTHRLKTTFILCLHRLSSCCLQRQITILSNFTRSLKQNTVFYTEERSFLLSQRQKLTVVYSFMFHLVCRFHHSCHHQLSLLSSLLSNRPTHFNGCSSVNTHICLM